MDNQLNFVKFLYISEPAYRSIMMTFTIIAYNCGIFIILTLGMVFSWRQVSLICALFPFCALIAVVFVIFLHF